MSDNIFNIFPKYITPENRVTASILSVLKSLALTRCEQILASLLEQSEFELIRFQNQLSKGSAGIPDAAIISSCRLLIETKIKPNSVKVSQLKQHLKRFDNSKETTQVLLVLTPDARQPAPIEELRDERVSWASFASLDQAINELFDDKRAVISEREAFLLRELQAMLERENLIKTQKDVLVIPARHAWPEYNKYMAYVCQPNRSFRPVVYLAFYHNNRIHELIPKILETFECVEMSRGLYSGKLGELVEYLLDNQLREEGKSYKVLLLSSPSDSETIRLDKPIENNLLSSSGTTSAFTQNQRYVELSALRKARTTSELV